jgi:hypothetical protein
MPSVMIRFRRNKFRDGMRRPASTGCVKLPQDALEVQKETGDEKE